MMGDIGLNATRSGFLQTVWPSDPRHLRRFLQLLAILGVGFLIAWQTALYVEDVFEKRQARDDAVDATRNAQLILADSLVDFAADMTIIAQSHALQRFAEGRADLRGEVAREFLVIMSAKHWVDQLRYIDRQGNEVIRVDRRGRKVAEVAPAELQNKADRYYVERGLALSPGALYVSRLDLNVEHGAVEIPWRPTLRIVIPVAAADGQALGLAVMNLSAAQMLEELSRIQTHGVAAIQLLNADGYWLAGAPDNQLWGFALDRHDVTLAWSRPAAWRAIAAESHGEFQGPNRHYTFASVRPEVLLKSELGLTEVNAGDRFWAILAIVPQPSLLAAWQAKHVPGVLLGLLVAFGIALSLSQAITSRRIAEENQERAADELMRSERMASLGRLVAGVAHELNTPIGNAVMVASTLSERLTEVERQVAAGELKRSTLDRFLADAGEGSHMLMEGLRRASELIRHFKQVAVDQTSEKRRRFRLGELVRDVASSLHPQFRGGIRLTIEIEAEAELDSYPGPLGQVLVNLIDNARQHGFREGESGEIVVTVREPDDGDALIEVRDTGRGMQPAVLKRIFEPFFTTRLGQGGSGLGLSIVHNIVTGPLGGSIRMESEPGNGATAFLSLPVTAPTDRATPHGGTYDVDRTDRAV